MVMESERGRTQRAENREIDCDRRSERERETDKKTMIEGQRDRDTDSQED